MLRLAVFGDPVAQSWSPVIQEAGLHAVGIRGTYRAIQVDRAGFLQGCDDVREGRLDGANVTMPYKRLAAEKVDRLTSDAERAGSVNTLVREGGRLVGYSTDVEAIRQVWRQTGLAGDAPVLVLGAGGAAAAALVALEEHERWVSARRAAAAVALSTEIGPAIRTVEWGRAVPGAVVVNATPLGMRGEELPRAVVEAAIGLFDMVYAPIPTPACRRAHAAGIPVAEGSEMLLAQAMLSFTLWTGVPAPAAAMRAALQNAQETG